MNKKIVILGGGFAGIEAAIKLQKYGYSTTLVSNRDYLFIYPISIWIPVNKKKFDEVAILLETLSKKLDHFENIEYKDEVIKSVCAIYEVKEWKDITFKTNEEYKKLNSIINQEIQKEKDLQNAGI